MAGTEDTEKSPKGDSADTGEYKPGEILIDGRPLEEHLAERRAPLPFGENDAWMTEILARHPGLLSRLKADAWVPLAVRAMPQPEGQTDKDYHQRLAKLSAAAGQGPGGEGFAASTVQDAIKNPKRKRHKFDRRR